MFELTLGEKKIICEPMGVVEHLTLEGQVSDIISKGLKAALGKDISDLFSDSDDVLNEGIVSAVASLMKFREATDWQALMGLIQSSCEKCQLVSKKKDGGEYIETLMLDDLDPLKREHYIVFGWFLECQLGNFTGYKKAKRLILKALKDMVKGVQIKSQE